MLFWSSETKLLIIFPTWQTDRPVRTVFPLLKSPGGIKKRFRSNLPPLSCSSHWLQQRATKRVKLLSPISIYNCQKVSYVPVCPVSSQALWSSSSSTFCINFYFAVQCSTLKRQDVECHLLHFQSIGKNDINWQRLSVRQVCVIDACFRLMINVYKNRPVTKQSNGLPFSCRLNNNFQIYINTLTLWNSELE